MLLAALSNAQEVRYIDDKVYVPMRSGPSNAYRIIHRGLPTGTRLTVMSKSEDGKFLEVKTNSGKQGWIPTQYLSKTPVAKLLLDDANKRVTIAEAENKDLKERLDNVFKKGKNAYNDLQALETEHTQVKAELARLEKVSSNTVKINNDNRRMLEENQRLKDQLDILETDNTRLQVSQSRREMLNDIMAVIIGVILALVIPRMAPKKRSEWV
jgi:SH3 domain protein